MRLTEKQWEKIKDLVPDGPVRSDGKGRSWKDKRAVLEGILWIVKTYMEGWLSVLNFPKLKL